MLLAVLMILGGVVVLPVTADWLMRGSTDLARRFGISEIVIGLTVVALGTSAPELVTSVVGALRGAPGIVLGNAVGSNLANLGLVLGIAALLGRIPVKRRLIWFDGILMLGITLLCWLVTFDGVVSRLDGLLLLAGFAGMTWWTVKRGDIPDAGEPDAGPPAGPVWLALVLIIGGIAGLAGGAEILVRGATVMARHFGVSDTLIGATIVALGTSLPELAATIAAVRRRRYGMLLGNLVGSCQFNLAAIVGIPALITPLTAEASMLRLHLPALAVISIAAWLAFWTRGMILRREGAILLLMYLCYIFLALRLS